MDRGYENPDQSTDDEKNPHRKTLKTHTKILIVYANFIVKTNSKTNIKTSGLQTVNNIYKCHWLSVQEITGHLKILYKFHILSTGRLFKVNVAIQILPGISITVQFLVVQFQILTLKHI